MNKEQLENAKKLFFIVLGIDIFILGISGIHAYLALGELERIHSGAIQISNEFIGHLQLWESIDRLIVVGMFGVGFCLVRWLGVCYQFAKGPLKATGFKNDKWTIAAWIIPFLNFFMPYLVINEVYKTGAKNYKRGDDWKKEKQSLLLSLWWIFWIVAHLINIIFNNAVSEKLFYSGAPLEKLISVHQLYIAFVINSIIIAILWFPVAGSLTNRLIKRLINPDTASASGGGQYPDTLYGKAYEELTAGKQEIGIWAKAFASAEGNQDKAKALYIKYRVGQLVGAEAGGLTQEASDHNKDVKTIVFTLAVTVALIAGLVGMIVIIGNQKPLINQNHEVAASPTKEEAVHQNDSAFYSDQKYSQEADSLYNNNNWAELEKHCIEWVNKYPNSRDAWNMLGIALNGNAKYDEAAKAYQAALRIEPGNKAILNNIEMNKSALENATFSQQAKKYADHKEWFAMENYCRIWTESYSNNAEAWVCLGYASYYNGKKDKSLAAFKKASALSPGNKVIMDSIESVQNEIKNARR